jgi:hypothetical protein
MGKMAAETVVKRIALESEAFPEVSVEPRAGGARFHGATRTVAAHDHRGSRASAVV